MPAIVWGPIGRKSQKLRAFRFQGEVCFFVTCQEEWLSVDFNETGFEVTAGEDSRQNYPWYAIHVRSKCEKAASTVLREKGFEEFLPLYRSRRQWSDRVKQLDLPLFPGYLFCRIDIAGRLLPVLTTPGVVGIVSSGKTPVAVSEREIEDVQAVLRSGLPTMPWPGLSAGSRILIEHGPLTGVEGTVLDINKKCRLIVSVALLQRSLAVEIQREWVRPLSTNGKVPATVPRGGTGSRESLR